MGLASGMIVMWSGNKNAIPNGWLLCDGSNGTPDLREKFIRGANVEAGASGGTDNHTHDFTGDGHFHDFEAGTDISSGFFVNDETTTENVTGTTDADDTLPPYFELIFLMKD